MGPDWEENKLMTGEIVAMGKLSGCGKDVTGDAISMGRKCWSLPRLVIGLQ
jgi:hypothetical protein